MMNSQSTEPWQADEVSGAATLDRQMITEAARLLASLRTHPRQILGKGKWTGRLFGRRVPVGLPVTLPNGETGWVKRVLRGGACVKTAHIDPIDGPIHDYFWVEELRPYKLPQAIALGRRKRGKSERASVTKRASSRRNGSMPVKLGSRRRGRPSRSWGSTTAPVAVGGAGVGTSADLPTH
jgi:hypothetical protein